MPGITFDEIETGFEPAPSWRFRLILPNFGAAGDFVSLLAENVNVPIQVLENEARFVSGSYVNYPKELNIDQLDFTFFEHGQDHRVSRYFQAWRDKVFDDGFDDLSKRGNFGLPVDYKRPVTVIIYDLQGEEAAIYQFENCWPLRSAPLALNGESSMALRYAMTLSVDRGRLIEN